MDSLVSVGVWFTLCGKGGDPKAVIWENYLERKPSAAQVMNHVHNGFPIGIVPFSCGCAVVDVDKGNHRRIADEHHPYLIYPSTSGFPKAHLWYRVGKPRDQHQFSFLDCSGQIISTNHVAFPNPETNLVALYQAFLNPSNSTYTLPPIPPHLPSSHGVGGMGMGIGIGASLNTPLPYPLPPSNSRVRTDGTLEGVGAGFRHPALRQELVGWIKAHPTKPSPDAIQDQALYLRDTIDDVHDFGVPEVLAMAAWAIQKVQAGSIARTLTAENRANGGRVKGLRVRQRNFQRDTQIVALHREKMSNRAIGARVGISEAMVRKVIKRELGL